MAAELCATLTFDLTILIWVSITEPAKSNGFCTLLHISAFRGCGPFGREILSISF
jgi:hypothetical protein